jgi:hypothetical protein
MHLSATIARQRTDRNASDAGSCASGYYSRGWQPIAPPTTSELRVHGSHDQAETRISRKLTLLGDLPVLNHSNHKMPSDLYEETWHWRQSSLRQEMQTELASIC